MSSTPNTRIRKQLQLWHPQVTYLKELLEDDLEVTELSPGERARAEDMLRNINNIIKNWPKVTWND